MIDRQNLLKALQRELVPLENDLRARIADNVAGWDDDLRAEHADAARVQRTASTYATWRDEQITQAAVSWLLACVFVRFCEDNGLVNGVWLAGPDDDTRSQAADAQAEFLLHNPTLNDRDWLQQAFSHLRKLPATAALFDEESTRLWLTPSADEAERLVRFWRGTDSERHLAHQFADPTWDTRFLGDLYQDLSAAARDKYALLQTPVFIEEFILDRTLTPALLERGVEGLTLIDPTCGSGHFLLGAFDRLLAEWQKLPGVPIREQVNRALDGVYGVDINPFAVAIARFRLIVAALRAEGSRFLEQAPDFHLHLAIGDSLLHGAEQLTLDSENPDADLAGFTYGNEDLEALRTILTPGKYDVVVGNPPYITVKDKALNAAYRARFATCKGAYALTIPFAERFFELARAGAQAGYVGQITSNSFMKREFGSKLIEDFLAARDLTTVIDTSGAYIPGHGTPTVILIGRRRPPTASTVRAVLDSAR